MSGRITIAGLIICCALMQFHCYAPPSVYRLSALEKDSEFFVGREIITKSDSVLTLSLNYEQSDNGTHEFTLIVTNRGTKPYTVDPAQISYACYPNTADMETGIGGRTGHSINPEWQLEWIDKKISSEKSSRANKVGTELFMTTLDFVATVATIGKEKTDEDRKKEQKEREERKLREEISEMKYEKKLANLENERKYWKDEVFRTTTIYPDEKYGGSIFIPVEPYIRYMRVQVPVENRIFTFDYEINEVK